jgi:hypothetical protein
VGRVERIGAPVVRRRYSIALITVFMLAPPYPVWAEVDLITNLAQIHKRGIPVLEGRQPKQLQLSFVSLHRHAVLLVQLAFCDEQIVFLMATTVHEYVR